MIAELETILAQARLAEGAWLNEALVALAAAAIGVVAALIAHRLLFRLLMRVAQGTASQTDDIVLARIVRPSRYALIALGLVLAAREIPALATVWHKVAGLVMPALIGWIALSLMTALVEALGQRPDIADADDRDARRRQTRLAIVSRIATFIIIFLTIGLMLLSIPGVRDIGVTLMASAGLAGLAVGAAAQPALKSLIAGFQMAITEPIAIDDVVIIDGEWGRVEDIRTTYVIVRTWDERRLIVPTVKFLENTFQNWTRESPDLLAPVILHLDPLTQIEPLRAEFLRQAQAHPLWDRRLSKLQVTETTADSIEVRMLASACSSSDAFDLRCDLREAMLAWIRDNQPDAIVQRRVQTSGQARDEDAAI